MTLAVIDPTDLDMALRAYAAGDATWSNLQARGLVNYVDVLAGLGRLGLRPPIAALDGPNTELRARGRALLRRALAAARP